MNNEKAHYVQQIIAVVTSPLKNVSEEFANAFTAMIEKNAKGITGLFNDCRIDKNGKVVFRKPEPVFTWADDGDRTHFNFLVECLKKQIIILPEGRHELSGVDVMFIQPDHTHTKVVAAWNCVNMTFNEIHVDPSQRDVSTTFEAGDLDIDFNVEVFTVDEETTKWAQSFLDSINLLAVNPYVCAKNRIALNDYVTLKSGGPIMRVVAYDSDTDVICTWQGEMGREVSIFPEASLSPAVTKT